MGRTFIAPSIQANIATVRWVGATIPDQTAQATPVGIGVMAKVSSLRHTS